MDTFGFLLTGFSVAATPMNLALAALGAMVGTMVGVLPGLGPVNAVAMLVPVVFALGLPPESSMILMASIYIGSEYGGRISAILINVPGEASAVMTALEGYPLSRQGKAGIALSLSAWTSFVGSMLATVGIVVAAPILSRWALAFGPVEYVALMVFAFASLAGLLADQPVKALLAVGVGLALSTVGIDPNSGVFRYTFDMPNLIDGIQFATIVIGLFAISELLLLYESHRAGIPTKVESMGRSLFNLAEMRLTGMATLRGSVIGFFIGLLPGAGGTVGSVLAYSTEKRIVERQDPAGARFGRGDLRGLASVEAANNSASNSNFIPMLTLGIPSSGTTAIMLGVLTLYNITPGPVLFTSQPELVWGLIASLFIGNVMLLAMNIPFVGLFARMLSVPAWTLVPFIVVVSAVGVYSGKSAGFDLVLMVVVGVIAWWLRRLSVPMAPLILGFVLGKILEQNLRRALSLSAGEVSILWSSWIAVVLWAAAALMLVMPMVFARLRKPDAPRAVDARLPQE
ncbi:tripartite tricarboxylate transporter permease [Aureimonas phyllosphaerae]|uniref:Putative tricarboxylic transport membrane protein n=1 Tax=Aureimonas phyllosphaerae TaxID=1166078 RepID=A0A7W6BS82_9HYPH|nr:tripartite tricarboxylate transporter permease [Aureimonas phyllosphaerae]MBB3937099.1 putative tricarboxylic transport membrane protein [Aureimonas phyllosphaerae]MBB3960786.1 putative tricarboxylic transport membrane protein [Aureimonas phyllosphaerae]SFF50187.1 putative tricarboxylic transport membrane protein [Aureimonas phyllosphaerae]